MAGDANSLLYGTVVTAIVAYAGAECLRFRGPSGSHSVARGLWTIGAIAILAHAAVAFHAHHGWSQAAAFDHVANRTAAVISLLPGALAEGGFAWGGGLFVNYAFLALWAADVAWWWWAPASYRTPAATTTHVMTAVFLFMFINAAVVFASGGIRLLGVAAVLAVGWAWYGRPRLPVPS